MSAVSTPQPSSRGSTPASRAPSVNGAVTTGSSHSKSSSKSKPANVFSNDGSFLERFLRTQKEEEESKKQEEELRRKRDFESRFKSRGKRRAPVAESSTETPEDNPTKKPKVDEDKPLSAYEKEVKSYTGSLKDTGTGIRPLVK